MALRSTFVWDRTGRTPCVRHVSKTAAWGSNPRPGVPSASDSWLSQLFHFDPAGKARNIFYRRLLFDCNSSWKNPGEIDLLLELAQFEVLEACFLSKKVFVYIQLQYLQVSRCKFWRLFCAIIKIAVCVRVLWMIVYFSMTNGIIPHSIPSLSGIISRMVNTVWVTRPRGLPVCTSPVQLPIQF